MFTLKPVKKEEDLKKFILLPFSIYSENSLWVPPLIKEVKYLLSDENPFWKHSERELFIVEDENGKVCGRIAAIVNYNHNAFWNDRIGFFGFFECINDKRVSFLLFEAACKWIKEKGMSKIRGPVNPSTNDECGFLLEGYEYSPAIMMPYTPSYYLDLCYSYGFVKAKDMYALIKNLSDGIPSRIASMIKHIEKRTKVTVRSIDMKNFERDVNILKDIYNSAWEKNWGFVPMTDEEINAAAKKLRDFIDPDLVLYAYVDGEPAGVSVTVPDINPILKMMNGKFGIFEILKFIHYRRKIKSLRSLIGGVKKEYRNTGIIAVLYYYTEVAAFKKGYKWCELGWNLEDNDLINRFDQAIGGKIYKKYRIVEKDV